MNIILKNCKICKKKLKGKQTKFCSNFCKGQDINHRHKNYQAQQSRGLSRKLQLIKLKGGHCEICKYNKNSAVLSFHHINTDTKSFSIDLRQCSNRSWNVLLTEVNKCRLLCANCHLELHYPDLVIKKL